MSNPSPNLKRSSLFTILVGIIVAFGRIVLLDNDEYNIMLIMAIVNIVAFGFVLAFMYNDIYTIVETKIKDSGISSDEKSRMKFMLEIVFVIFIVVYGLFGILYVKKFRSVKYNDALSIIALAFSIANDNFAQYISKPFYSVVCHINRFIRKTSNKKNY